MSVLYLYIYIYILATGIIYNCLSNVILHAAWHPNYQLKLLISQTIYYFILTIMLNINGINPLQSTTISTYKQVIILQVFNKYSKIQKLPENTKNSKILKISQMLQSSKIYTLKEKKTEKSQKLKILKSEKK